MGNTNYCKMLPIFILGVLLFFTPSVASGEALREEYRYEVLPLRGEGRGQKEVLEMEFVHTQDRILYTSKNISSDSLETIKIELLADGRFLKASKDIRDTRGERILLTEIRRDEKKVYIKRPVKGAATTREYVLPQDMPLAVDASLLALMRSFPFDKAVTWRVFMVDFSRHSVSVNVRQVGIENIIVPAGEFECYRMEVAVNLLIFHPKITYWISKKKPHFLVKHTGKRGPFTGSYVTSLVEIHDNIRIK